MPHLAEVGELPAFLRATLAEMMPAATFSESHVAEGHPPLVVMLRGHAVDAFAIGDEQDYEPLYAGFKKHYLAQGSEWTSKEISFVFCLPSGSPAEESFCSEVEVDVYFCRKYVLNLSDDLAESLARLPFLPLTKIAGGPIRPPSAQTLLRQRSMKADLARNLVEQGTSAATILEACLSGRHGDAYAIDERSVIAASDVDAEPRRDATLKSISIQNFRAYRKTKNFPLGSAVTVLYGPNGFGKTSFFDAIDFAVTGGVGRLERAKGGLAKVAKHLDSEGEATEVSLTFERDGATHVITRSLDSPNDATLDGEVTSRKAVLTALTGGTSAPADRVDNMVALFRATHLFSQDRQELTGQFAMNCVLPADIVSRMLAFDDYVNGVKKSAEVLKLAKQQLEISKREAKDARDRVAVDTQEIKRLEGLLAESTSPDALNAGFAQLEQAISDAGLNLGQVNPRDTRSLRAALEGFAEGENRRHATLDKAREQASRLLALKEQLGAVSAVAESKRQAATQAEAALVEAEQSVALATRELTLRQTQEQEVKRLRDWFVWAVSVEPTYARLKEEHATLTARFPTLSQEMSERRKGQEQAALAHGQATATLRRAEEAFTVVAERRSRLESVGTTLSGAEAIGTQLVLAREAETLAQQGLDAEQLLVAKAAEAVRVQSARVAAINSQLAVARTNASSLKGLLSELRAHASGSSCLLCGHDHGSHEALLGAMDRQAEQSALVLELTETLAAERETQHALELAAEEKKAALAQALQRFDAARARCQELERQKSELSKALASVGLALADRVAAEHALLSERVLEEERVCLDAIRSAQVQLATAETNLANARQLFSSVDTELRSVSVAIEAATKQLDDLRATAQTGVIDLDTGLASLQASQLREDEQLATASSLTHSAATSLEQRRSAYAAASASASAARTSLADAVQAFNACSAETQSLSAGLTAAGIAVGTSEAQLLELMKEAASRAAVAFRLRDRAAQLEVSANAAATSAAFESIRVRIDSHEQVAKKADARAEAIAPWVKYFDGVSRLLTGQQALATNHFTTEYGPRTATIQRRLRPVYGFESIKVVGKDSAIEVHVSRNGEELRPTDYFSQSQVQTLVLGLFLTACSSQTWSGFSSIMMDDPVTHFDDLNTYALLDLISGLQSSPEGDRQFVISTCDEKLLQLARQKFRHLGESAKFYRFSAIGADGPMVAELPA